MTTTLLCVAFPCGKVVVGQLYGQAMINSDRTECATVLPTELHAYAHEKSAELL